MKDFIIIFTSLKRYHLDSCIENDIQKALVVPPEVMPGEMEENFLVLSKACVDEKRTEAGTRETGGETDVVMMHLDCDTPVWSLF